MLAESMAAWVSDRIGVDERPDYAVRWYVVQTLCRNVIVNELDVLCLERNQLRDGKPLQFVQDVWTYSTLDAARNKAAELSGTAPYWYEAGSIALVSKPEWEHEVSMFKHYNYRPLAMVE